MPKPTFNEWIACRIGSLIFAHNGKRFVFKIDFVKYHCNKLTDER